MKETPTPSPGKSEQAPAEKKSWQETIRDPRRRFRWAFEHQFVKRVNEDYVWPDGRITPGYRQEHAPGAHELADRLIKFWQDAEENRKQYWKKDISKTGASFHDSGKFHLGQIEEFKFGVEHYDVGGMTGEGVTEDTQLAFDIFTCIEETKPDLIISLANGGSHLSTIANTMGFDADNYLSIHRNVGTDNYRKDMPTGPIYEGKPITPGSRVLILEDTTSLQDERTYRDARAWLSTQGVTDAPVFLERMVQLTDEAVSTEKYTDEDFIAVQDELVNDNCYNSYCRWELRRKNVAFWAKMRNKLVDATEKDPGLYERFFDLIRNRK